MSCLAEFLFTASGKEIDYYQNELNVRIINEDKTSGLVKLGNFRKIPDMLGFDGEHPSDTVRGKCGIVSGKFQKISCKTFQLRLSGETFHF